MLCCYAPAADAQSFYFALPKASAYLYSDKTGLELKSIEANSSFELAGQFFVEQNGRQIKMFGMRHYIHVKTDKGSARKQTDTVYFVTAETLKTFFKPAEERNVPGEPRYIVRKNGDKDRLDMLLGKDGVPLVCPPSNSVLDGVDNILNAAEKSKTQTPPTSPSTPAQQANAFSYDPHQIQISQEQLTQRLTQKKAIKQTLLEDLTWYQSLNLLAPKKSFTSEELGAANKKLLSAMHKRKEFQGPEGEVRASDLLVTLTLYGEYGGDVDRIPAHLEGVYATLENRQRHFQSKQKTVRYNQEARVSGEYAPDPAPVKNTSRKNQPMVPKGQWLTGTLAGFALAANPKGGAWTYKFTCWDSADKTNNIRILSNSNSSTVKAEEKTALLEVLDFIAARKAGLIAREGNGFDSVNLYHAASVNPETWDRDLMISITPPKVFRLDWNKNKTERVTVDTDPHSSTVNPKAFIGYAEKY